MLDFALAVDSIFSLKLSFKYYELQKKDLKMENKELLLKLNGCSCKLLCYQGGEVRSAVLF